MSKFLSTEERLQLAQVLQHSLDRHTDHGETVLHFAGPSGLVEKVIHTLLEGVDPQEISYNLPGAVRRAITESDAPLADAVDVLLDEFEDDEIEGVFDSVRAQLGLPPASYPDQAGVGPEDIIANILAGAAALGIHPSQITILRAA